MGKLEVCKKLSRLGWASQAVVDYHKTLPHWAATFLYGIYMETYLDSIVMDKICWGSSLREDIWPQRYEDGHSTMVKDI